MHAEILYFLMQDKEKTKRQEISRAQEDERESFIKEYNNLVEEYNQDCSSQVEMMFELGKMGLENRARMS